MSRKIIACTNYIPADVYSQILSEGMNIKLQPSTPFTKIKIA